jgi:manganese efflux pump family protein
MEKLKKRWNIDSNLDLILILIGFSITGSLSAYLSKPITNLIGLSSETTPLYIFIPIRILILFPIYQILMVIVGSLLGQFKFFWSFEKKMLARIRLNRFADFIDSKLDKRKKA